MNAKDILPSLIRTFVPLAVSAIVGWAAAAGFQVDDSTQAALTTVLGAVVAFLYYVIVRLLEGKFPWVSILLGSTKAPVGYAPTQAVNAGNATPPSSNV